MEPRECHWGAVHANSSSFDATGGGSVDVDRARLHLCSGGTALGNSAHTVTTYIKSSDYKLGVHAAGAAVMRAVELGLLVPVGATADGHASIPSLAAVRVLNTGAV